VNARLGTNLSDGDIATILEKLGLSHERVDDPIARVIETAKSVLGAEYKPDSAMRFDAPRAFSCSSLTNYCYVQAGVALPSISIDQYVWGTPIAKEDARLGDLVFLNTENGHIRYETVQWLKGTKVPEGVDHVGIYLGGDEVLHATRGPGAVVIEKISENKVFEGIVGYRRVITHDEPRFVVMIPFERLDLRQGADLIEEIGRVHGYDRIVPTALPQATHPPISNAMHIVAETIRLTLSRAGFSEIMTYTLRDAGASELANALASDKSFLREKLAPGIREALDKNEYYAPLLGLDAIRIFEIGTTFSSEHEAVHVGIGARASAGKKRDERTEQLLQGAVASIALAFGVEESLLNTEHGEGTVEFDLALLTESIPAAIEAAYRHAPIAPNTIRYTAPSVHPFVLRDIALWSDSEEAGPVLEIITQNAGPLLVRADMFDTFTKDGRTSYAFHLAFQSYEKTLTDDEVGKIMQDVTDACTKQGWEVR
jgi:phenylalanyl-tRNA synthetase beta subunit